MKTKRCPKCGKSLSVKKFHNHKNRKDGLATWCKNCRSQYAKEYYSKNKERYKRQKKEYYSKNKERINQQTKEYHRRTKIGILSHYAGKPPKCACCGESHIEFLGIDHINGKGTKHRREIAGGGGNFYYWLKRNNYPTGYRVLCHNCNCALGFFGYCPHKIS